LGGRFGRTAVVRCAGCEVAQCGHNRHWCLSMLLTQHCFACAANFLLRCRSSHGSGPRRVRAEPPYAPAVIADAAFVSRCNTVRLRNAPNIAVERTSCAVGHGRCCLSCHD
jgi:hypothetical protein